VVPDLFNGSEVTFPAPEDFNLQEYIDKTMPRVSTVDPIIASVIEALRGEMGVEKVGGVGYCFGGKYVCRWLKEGMQGLDVGYVAHPSFVDADEVKGIEGPLSIAAAGTLSEWFVVWVGGWWATETDSIFTVEKRHETEEILAQHTVPYQIFLYSDVEHGFAVKGHMSTAKARFAKEQAFLQAVTWFDEYLKKGWVEGVLSCDL
jgi:dienelactone hydrolase